MVPQSVHNWIPLTRPEAKTKIRPDAHVFALDNR